jgi:uncharacterized cupredoxin-like copper-binding protein
MRDNSKGDCLKATLAACVLAWTAAAMAAGDLAAQKPITLTVKLGDEQGALKFYPDTIRLETGKLYRLRLVNPSPAAHYFVSEQFAAAVYTRKVQVNAPDGKPLAEVKGSIREIEVYPGGTAEWWFVPVRTGTFADLRCTIAGHTEGGMVGRIVVE